MVGNGISAINSIKGSTEVFDMDPLSLLRSRLLGSVNFPTVVEEVGDLDSPVGRLVTPSLIKLGRVVGEACLKWPEITGKSQVGEIL